MDPPYSSAANAAGALFSTTPPAGPGFIRASTAAGVWFSPFTGMISRRQLARPAACSCSPLPRPRPLGRPPLLAAHPAGALCFTSSETHGSEGVRCGAVGRKRCGTVEGGASRFVAVTGGPVKVVARHEPTKRGRETAVSRRNTRRPVLGTVPSPDGRG